MNGTTIANCWRQTIRGPGFRVALTIGGLMACLLACGVACGLGKGGSVDYVLFVLWAFGTAAGICWGKRVLRSPIWGAALGGMAGVVAAICYVHAGFVIAAFELAFATRSIGPFLHPPTENALGETAMVLMGIVTSAIVGTAARLAGEGLVMGAQKHSSAARNG